VQKSYFRRSAGKRRECKAYRIAQLDRVERADGNGRDDEPGDDTVPF